MTLDVPSLDSDTPGAANVLHFNNTGAALPPRQWSTATRPGRSTSPRLTARLAQVIASRS